jgi:hypothetical protein
MGLRGFTKQNREEREERIFSPEWGRLGMVLQPYFFIYMYPFFYVYPFFINQHAPV